MANSCIGEGLLRALYRPFAMRDISFAPQRYKIPTINYYNIVLISGGEEIRGQKREIRVLDCVLFLKKVHSWGGVTEMVHVYIAEFLFPQQIYCINLKGTVGASSLFSSRQLATCSSRPPRRGGGVRSRASSTPNCILEWKIRQSPQMYDIPIIA